MLNRVEAVGSSTAADDDDGDACTPPDINQFEPDLSTEMPATSHDDDDMPSTGCNAQSVTKAILPPPISKTKGSRYKNTAESRPSVAGKKMKLEEAVLKTDDKTETGKRKCGVCGEIGSGHNARSCPTKFPKDEKKQLNKQSKRICQGCKQIGSGHNILSCPVIKAALEIAKKINHKSKKNNNMSTAEDDDEDNDIDEEDTEEEEERTPPPPPKKNKIQHQ